MTSQSEPSRNITTGLIDRAEVAAELKCGERTILRYEHSGMPVVKIGKLRLYEPAAVREWLLAHAHRHEEPRRGRPSARRFAIEPLGRSVVQATPPTFKFVSKRRPPQAPDSL
jgi:hypothetical protein